jgi:hypothetical protein
MPANQYDSTLLNINSNVYIYRINCTSVMKRALRSIGYMTLQGQRIAC